MRARAVALFAALIAIVALSGCGRGAVPPRPVDDAKHEAWVEPIFGRAADLAVVMNMRRLRDDPTYTSVVASMRTKAGDDDVDPSILRALLDCDAISLEGVVLDWRKPWQAMQWMFIARGEPADLSPDALRDRDRPVFQFVQKTPAGVAIYAMPRDSGQTLFVFPGNTWVLASNGLVERLAHASRPPPLDFDANVMLAGYMSSALLRAGATQGEVREKALMDGIDFSVVEVDAPAGDDSVAVGMKLVYLDDAFAKEAERALDVELRRVEDMAKEQAGDAAALVTLLHAALSVSRDGRVLKVDLRVPRVLLEKAAKSGD